mmetsp:Transcript_13738/g.28267  ORF Transcript_13738/g.28267 Transcript_13738/m.28267 type:complete len:365 (-) Transcript_13738:652-1746(-)
MLHLGVLPELGQVALDHDVHAVCVPHRRVEVAHLSAERLHLLRISARGDDLLPDCLVAEQPGLLRHHVHLHAVVLDSIHLKVRRSPLAEHRGRLPEEDVVSDLIHLGWVERGGADPPAVVVSFRHVGLPVLVPGREPLCLLLLCQLCVVPPAVLMHASGFDKHWQRAASKRTDPGIIPSITLLPIPAARRDPRNSVVLLRLDRARSPRFVPAFSHQPAAAKPRGVLSSLRPMLRVSSQLETCCGFDFVLMSQSSRRFFSLDALDLLCCSRRLRTAFHDRAWPENDSKCLYKRIHRWSIVVGESDLLEILCSLAQLKSALDLDVCTFVHWKPKDAAADRRHSHAEHPTRIGSPQCCFHLRTENFR